SKLTTDSFLIPVSGSGIYEGQAFSGSWNIQLPLTLDIISATPGALTFSQFTGNNGPNFSTSGQVVFPDIGLSEGAGGDDSISYSWNQVSNVAAAVPEPGTIIFGAMLLPWGARALWKPRRRG